MIQRILDLIKSGEGMTIEFKESRNKLTKDIYETVCSFLNRLGGDIILGVDDHGQIVGIDPDQVAQIKKEFASNLNNRQKINPPFYLTLNPYEIDGRTVLHVFVPMSSDVHRCIGRIYDRNEDGDFDITDNTNLVAEMFIRKQRTYTVNEVFPFAEMVDLRSDLIQLVRKRVTNIHDEPHPWTNLTDLELLRSAGLFLKDYLTGKEGITMAGILLFGKDETILSVLPHHRTDAIVRRINLDRYDDRDDIRTNLLESYSRLLAFCAKHLNDPFYLDGDTRISLRDKIVRELAANMLIHREYVMAYPATLVIESGRLYTENSNRPHGYGRIDINHFTPYPKNPMLAKMFKEIGYADELGSGIRNTTRYTALYSGKIPVFEEGDVFRVIIPLKPENLPQGLNATLKLKSTDAGVGENVQQARGNTQQATQRDGEHDGEHDGQHDGEHDGLELNKMQTILLAFCETPKTRNDIMEYLGLKDRMNTYYRVIKPLLVKGLLLMAYPEKPRSPLQKYHTALPTRY